MLLVFFKGLQCVQIDEGEAGIRRRKDLLDRSVFVVVLSLWNQITEKE